MLSPSAEPCPWGEVEVPQRPYLAMRKPVEWMAAGADTSSPGTDFRDGCTKFPRGRANPYGRNASRSRGTTGAVSARGASTYMNVRTLTMHPTHKKPRWALYALLAAASVGAGYELHTAALEARLFSKIASSLDYEVEPGKSDRIVFPEAGPMDR